MTARPHQMSMEALCAAQAAPGHRAFRRDVNEQISSINHDLGVVEDDTLEVICECGHPQCSGLIEMTVAEYEAIRRFPTHFVVKTRHEVAESERIVAEFYGHVVIESTGRVGLRAVTSDPRRRPSTPVRPER